MDNNPTIEIRRISPHGLDAILVILKKEYEDALTGVKVLPRDEVADQLNKLKSVNEAIYTIERFQNTTVHHIAQLRQLMQDGA